MIEINKVTKRYGNFCAVNEISLSVREGEVFAFLGLNGAGKTTTLSMIAGLLKPTSGSIRVGGFDTQTQSLQAKRAIGYIPDRPYLYPKLTAREFLYFVGDLYSMPLAELDQQIDQVLAEFKLEEWQHELTESYSHGMKQRLATCSALLHKPKVLVIDEPMVGLDPHGAKFFKGALRRYADEGNTVFLSTHSLHVAEEISDRIAIIEKGSLVAMGTLAEVKQRNNATEFDLEELFLQLTSVAEVRQ